MFNEVSAEGLPALSSQADGEPMPSAWADDLAPLDLDTDPEAVTAPARRRPPRSVLARSAEAGDQASTRREQPAGARAGGASHPARYTLPSSRVPSAIEGLSAEETVAAGASSGERSDSADEEATGTFTVCIQPPLGMLSDTGQAVATQDGFDVRRLSARRLHRLDRQARRALFVQLSGQPVVLGTELVEVQGQSQRRAATASALVLLVNRHVSRHRARPLVAEMFAAAPETLLDQVAVDRRLSRAVADHLPALAAQMAQTSQPLLRQALASWLRQRSDTATQAVARLLRQAPTYDRHRDTEGPLASPERCAALLVDALEVLIAQQAHAAGACAIAVARLVEPPPSAADGQPHTHWDAVTTRLCVRAAAGFC